MNLPEFSVKNSVFGNVLFAVVAIVGLIVAMNTERELFPATDLDMVVITTLYPGALPDEVENHVTIPIERELRSVDGLDKYLSTSIENVSSVQVFIDPDADNKERVINDVLRKVDRVRFENDQIEEPDVQVIATREMVIHVCVGGAGDFETIRDYADQLESRISKIDRVGAITKTGWRDPEIWVEVDVEKMREQELSMSSVVESLQSQNVNLPGGKIPEGSKELMLRTMGQFRNLSDIGNVVVRSNQDGQHVNGS